MRVDEKPTTAPQAPTMSTSTAATSLTDYDHLAMLEINDESSIRFLDAKPAVRSFFMRIDSIDYERDAHAEHLNEVPIGKAVVRALNRNAGGISVSNHLKHRYKNNVTQWANRSMKVHASAALAGAAAHQPPSSVDGRASASSVSGSVDTDTLCARPSIVDKSGNTSMFEHIIQRHNVDRSGTTLNNQSLPFKVPMCTNSHNLNCCK